MNKTKNPSARRYTTSTRLSTYIVVPLADPALSSCLVCFAYVVMCSCCNAAFGPHIARIRIHTCHCIRQLFGKPDLENSYAFKVDMCSSPHYLATLSKHIIPTYADFAIKSVPDLLFCILRESMFGVYQKHTNVRLIRVAQVQSWVMSGVYVLLSYNVCTCPADTCCSGTMLANVRLIRVALVQRLLISC